MLNFCFNWWQVTVDTLAHSHNSILRKLTVLLPTLPIYMVIILPCLIMIQNDNILYSVLCAVVYNQEWCREQALTADKRFSLPLCCLQGLKHWRRKCTPASPALPPCLRAASRLACNHNKNVSMIITYSSEWGGHCLKSYHMCHIMCLVSALALIQAETRF